MKRLVPLSAAATRLLALCVVAGVAAGCARRYSDPYYEQQRQPEIVSAEAEPAAQPTPAASRPSNPSAPEPPLEAIPSLPAQTALPASSDAGRNVALVIGIDAYAAWPRLDNAVNDARAVGAVLREQYGFARVSELYDQSATRAGILAAVRTLVQGMKGGESVFIFYSGHGHFDETLQRGYWMPVDAKGEDDFLANSEIHDYIKAMDKRGARHVFLVADSCFSGTFLGVTREMKGLGVRAQSPSSSAASAATGSATEEYLEKLATSRSRMALTSGSKEPVPDGGAEGHSVFAYYLLQALRRPDYAAFTGTELAAKVQRLVGFNSEQTPCLGCILYAGHEGGEFVFRKRP